MDRFVVGTVFSLAPALNPLRAGSGTLALLFCLGSGGCAERGAGGDGNESGDTATDGGEGDGGGGCGAGSANSCETVSMRAIDELDLIFVIDNSGSMGPAQGALAVAAGALVERLDLAGVDYRVAFTTTDNGGCSTDTTPEGGGFELSSCRDRLDEFVFQLNPEIDAQEIACTNFCTLADNVLSVLPTTTHDDPDPKPRPWLQKTAGISNLPEGVDMQEAIRCALPQGISGCGWEQPLESLHKSLVRAQQGPPSEQATLGTEAGFLRPGARLAVVLLTDEADCSFTDKDLVSTDGPTVFWEDSAAFAPTSAVCWNAAVRCTGDPAGYEECVSENYDLAGNPGASDADAVMRPYNRYWGLLDGIRGSKRELDPSNELLITAIAGVQADGSVVYAETSDAEFSLNFGIGPGCIQGGGEIRAVPPVRIRELAEQFQVDDEQVLFSICEQDQSPAVQAIGDRIFERMPASCYPICAFDMDPSTEVVEGNCSVKIGEGSDAIEVMECLRDGADYVEQEGGYVMPNEGADVCFAMLGDSTGATPSALDDVQSECADEGFNLGLAFERRDGAPYSAADQLSVNCQLEPEWQLHCPGIN